MNSQINGISSGVELNVAVFYPETVVRVPRHISNFCNHLACKLVNSDENSKQVIRLNANIVMNRYEWTFNDDEPFKRPFVTVYQEWTFNDNEPFKGLYDLIFIFRDAKNTGRSLPSDHREMLKPNLAFLQPEGKLVHIVPAKSLDFNDPHFQTANIMTNERFNLDSTPETRVDMVPLVYRMNNGAMTSYQNQIQELLTTIQTIASQKLLLAQKNQGTQKDQEANSEASTDQPSNNEQEVVTVAEKTSVESDTIGADSGAILPKELLPIFSHYYLYRT